jgi:CRISPR/Cas system-associated exonuclease Cas4 (RecB family)
MSLTPGEFAHGSVLCGWRYTEPLITVKEFIALNLEAKSACERMREMFLRIDAGCKLNDACLCEYCQQQIEKTRVENLGEEAKT